MNDIQPRRLQRVALIVLMMVALATVALVTPPGRAFASGAGSVTEGEPAKPVDRARTGCCLSDRVGRGSGLAEPRRRV